MHDQSALIRTARPDKDAATILKVFRNISSLCDVFQVSALITLKLLADIIGFRKIDTRLHIEATVQGILTVTFLK